MDNLVLDTTFTNEGAEPVTLLDVKGWLKIDVSDDDALLTELITTARQDCEAYLNISLIERTVTAFLQIGLEEMRLPYGPVKEVTAVTSIDGVTVIESFIMKYESFKAIDPITEIKVVYTAGFNGNLPKHFKTAILKQTAWQYEHRGDDTDATSSLSPEVMRQLKPHRRVV
jgi:hypothetical protein